MNRRKFEQKKILIVLLVSLGLNAAAAQKQSAISFTTNKDIGQNISLSIDAESKDQSKIWIDLNNNGKQDNGEKVTQFGTPVHYVLGADDIKVYGKIAKFNCAENKLLTLDISKSHDLVELYCEKNFIRKLDVSNNKKLTHLYCFQNNLSELDIKNNKALIRLFANNNQLTSLDLSQNKEIEVLTLNNNEITQLDISNNVNLKRLFCYSNYLTSLDVSRNLKLNNIFCYRNNFSACALDDLYRSLPIREASSKCVVWIVHSTFPGAASENPGAYESRYQIANAKNWKVQDRSKNTDVNNAIFACPETK